ncbi:hypothetical protein [Pedobacter gandavensis]|uniref:Bacterial toxin 44 domain-containing protein n=1 Tax=Pedobacter gandavensis TaxID=2679963 RepID=A0ABR6EU72_9SPHI|nr:hypothetical protein [Pedobacter gandavensis]MBB2148809.1 hypothetical protein [Pedobacter gandavensis]
MRVKLEAKFTAKDIEKLTQEYIQRVVKVTQNELIQVGLQFVRDARAKIPSEAYHSVAGDARTAASLAGGSVNLSSADGFNDDTGNLRSSIGFILMYDGEVVHQDFQLSPRGSDKNSGLNNGIAYANKLGKEYSSGWAIITVAGMEYASWVEALGYDVITGSTLGAEQKLEKAFRNVNAAFGK